MSDDIRTLTTRLAEEPTSLAFLELAEALRRRGQLEAACKVARGGLGRYPGLADAHDLLGRILGDQGDLAGAFDAWADALRLDPMRAGALKGIGFLYFRAGDSMAALDHLERAAEADPDDVTITQALARVRRELRGVPRPPEPGPAPAGPEKRTTADPEPVEQPDPGAPFAELEGGHSLVLVDANGLRLAGSLPAPDGDETGDRVAAHLAGVSREAARAARLLDLGSWQTITVESPDAHFVLVRPSPETVLLATRDPSLPMARVALVAERAARAAKTWLEQVQ
ncbi:MAG: tetratricopeptide repeat protein [Gemmatimonadales bacterium]|nr:tetratricopeptide repeat protein [Gemmatimonadales bacterium]